MCIRDSPCRTWLAISASASGLERQRSGGMASCPLCTPQRRRRKDSRADSERRGPLSRSPK
eukprot:324410-Alexandrium_andersonii.AAC.1